MSNYIQQLEDQNAKLLHNNALMEKKIADLESILVRNIQKEVDDATLSKKELIDYMFSMLGMDTLNKVCDVLADEYKAEVKRILMENYKAGKYE